MIVHVLDEKTRSSFIKRDNSRVWAFYCYVITLLHSLFKTNKIKS